MALLSLWGVVGEGSRARRRFVALCGVAAFAAALPGCSIEKLAVNRLGDALASGSDTFAADDDPEFVGTAIPFGLKTIEGLLAKSPRHEGLLFAATSGFTSYAYAYLQCEADYVEDQDLARATELRARAVRMYKRALGYGLRGLEVAHPGFAERIKTDPGAAVAQLKRADVPTAYWTAAAWGAAIGMSKQDVDLVADLPAVEALMRRVVELDEGYAEGAPHDLLLAYESRAAAAGGSEERARTHFEAARRLSNGRRAGPLVALAESVDVPKQDKAEFERLLNEALAIDPDAAPRDRMANLVAQKRARWLLGRTDRLFVE